MILVGPSCSSRMYMRPQPIVVTYPNANGQFVGAPTLVGTSNTSNRPHATVGEQHFAPSELINLVIAEIKNHVVGMHQCQISPNMGS